jgi:predicted AAA+ superfamily ATPase
MNDKIIKRALEDLVLNDMFQGKTIMILGPRQVGKTTLITRVQSEVTERNIVLNGDNPGDREILNGISSGRARQLFPDRAVLYIDEAQRLENSGLTLKVIHDSCPHLQMIVTGSGAFELSDRIREPMTGRKFTWHLYPLSAHEIASDTSLVDYIRNIDQRLIFGSYPDVINYAGSEPRVLNELVTDYLFKDVFMLRDIRKPERIENLVKALAFQIGREVSNRELANSLQIDKETVERYIRLLEDNLIVFRLPSFSRNLRNELKRSKKIYFYDTGIRNAVIQRFAPMALRDDQGMLWENFLLTERLRFNHYRSYLANMYFWRTTSRQEIDYIEEHEGLVSAYEFKWNPRSKARIPAGFIEAYQPEKKDVITRDNFLPFLGVG